ncbi:MAG: hypothetical protein ACERKN_04665 [Velocimicrobium sp.]
MVASSFAPLLANATVVETEGQTELKVVTTPIESSKSTTGNPLVGFNATGDRTYSGDPAAFVDGDTVYFYTGHDTATSESYVIPEWQCYSSKDMMNWTYEGVILKASNISWARDITAAWAG